MKDSRIAIAGGGIGGLTLAAALIRKGIDAVVLERSSEFETVGSGITMQINAMQALRHIGLAEGVEAAGNRLDRLVLRTRDGNTLFVSDMAKPAREFGVPFVCIHRARLHEVLLAALPPEAVTLGFAVQGCSENAGRVTVSSSDGREIEADALVGADGLRSQVRKQLWGDQPLRYSGVTSWRGVVANDDFVPLDEATEIWGDRSNFGFLPLADGQLYWFATQVAEYGQQDVGDPRESILPLFKGWHRPIEQVVEATDPKSILRTDIWDRRPRMPWGQGRITLLGDSAHPMTPNMGQGGGQAVEDAVVLAEVLSQAASLPEGLREYERRRFSRTKFFVDNSHRATALSHGMTPLMRFARRWAVPHVPDWLRERQIRKVFRFEA